MPNDTIGLRHPSVKEMSARIRYLFGRGEKLDFQAAGSPCTSTTLEELHTLEPMLHTWSVKDLVSHLQKLLHTPSTALVLIAKMVTKKVLCVTDTELSRDSPKDSSGCSPKAQIPINYKTLQGLQDSISKWNQDRFPSLSILTSHKLGHGNIFGMDIHGEKKSMLLALDEDGLSICQKIASPSRFQFFGYLLKAFAAFPQLINPTKICKRGDVQLSSYSPIRRFFSEVKSGSLIMHGGSQFKAFIKRLPTSQALISLNSLKFVTFSLSLNRSIFYGLIPIAMGPYFFQSSTLFLLANLYHG